MREWNISSKKGASKKKKKFATGRSIDKSQGGEGPNRLGDANYKKLAVMAGSS